MPAATSTISVIVNTPKVAAIVLAAGGGTRFRHTSHKLRAELNGRPVFSWTLAAVIGAGFDHVFVVTGAVELVDLVATIVDGSDSPDGGGCGVVEDPRMSFRPPVQVVHNPRWSEGQSTSLSAGIAAARALGVDAVVVGLGDQPGVPTSAWESVRVADQTPIAMAEFDGMKRPPVRLAKSTWDELPDHGDEGARNLIRSRPELVRTVACEGNPADIDTLEDLERWN